MAAALVAGGLLTAGHGCDDDHDHADCALSVVAAAQDDGVTDCELAIAPAREPVPRTTTVMFAMAPAPVAEVRARAPPRAYA